MADPPLRPSEDLRRSLVDPRGGWLAASIAWEWSQVGGSRWSFDVGGTGRFLEMPDTNTPADATRSSVGVITSGGGHSRLAVVGGKSNSGVSLFLIGGYEIGWLLPEASANVFAAPLDQLQQRADGAAAFWLRPAHLYLSTQFRWMSDGQLGHQVAFGLTVVP
jgi:hypothetical protein